MQALFRFLLALASLALPISHAAQAQEFPSKPIRLVVPFPAGGTVDGLARALQQELAAAVGQTVIIDNKPGAGGRIGTADAVRAAPDGYTIVMVYDNYATDPVVYKDLPYDPWKDLLPVSLLARAPLVAIATLNAPYSNLRELVDYAKANPGKVDFGSTGAGSSAHLMGELFALQTGTKMVHIPYKGGAPAANELMGGTLQLFWGTVPYAKSLQASGKVKLLGQSGKSRASALPDVPTLAEQGQNNIEVYGWTGFMLPAGTPQAIVDKWTTAIRTASGSPSVAVRLNGQGFEVVAGSPQEFAAYLRAENRKWQDVITTAKIPLQ